MISDPLGSARAGGLGDTELGHGAGGCTPWRLLSQFGAATQGPDLPISLPTGILRELSSLRAEPGRHRPFCRAAGVRGEGLSGHGQAPTHLPPLCPLRPSLEPASQPPSSPCHHPPHVTGYCQSEVPNFPKALCPVDWGAETETTAQGPSLPGCGRQYLVVLPGGHAGLLGQGWLLGGPAAGGSTGSAGILIAGRPHGTSQHIVLLPQLPQPHALGLQRLLQLQDADLQPRKPAQGGLTACAARLPQSSAPKEEQTLTWVSISCFLSLMRDRPEKSMVSVIRAGRGAGVSVCAPAPTPATTRAHTHLSLRSAPGRTCWRPPRWRPSR